jgi:hypothetical protein
MGVPESWDWRMQYYRSGPENLRLRAGAQLYEEKVSCFSAL